MRLSFRLRSRSSRTRARPTSVSDIEPLMDGPAPRAREEQALPGEFSSLRTRGAAAWSRRELSEPRQACSDPRADRLFERAQPRADRLFVRAQPRADRLFERAHQRADNLVRSSLRWTRAVRRSHELRVDHQVSMHGAHSRLRSIRAFLHRHHSGTHLPSQFRLSASH